MAPQIFWMVWVSHTRGPTQRHPSAHNAREEAKRLALLPENEGRNVYVLEATGYCYIEKQPVLWKPL